MPMARIDDAVTRILRVKMRLGLFEAGKPSSRALLGGEWKLLGAPEHRAIAREAVRKSLVLLQERGRAAAQARRRGCWSPATAPTTSRASRAAGR